MAKKKVAKAVAPKSVSCCPTLANKLGVDLNDCFEDGPTSAKEVGVSVAFRYNDGVIKGMCKLDLRCLLADWKDKQCDFLFYRCQTGVFYFVELKKPQAWKEAYAQIVNTISYFEKKKGSDIDKNKVVGYVVSRNSPPKANLVLRDLQADFKKRGYSFFDRVNIGEQTWID